MEYAAHISDGEIQTVREHCRNTAEYCSGFCLAAGASNFGRLLGYLHDVGKLTSEFNEYIHGRSSIRRGELDHSYGGARYIMELFGSAYRDIAMLAGRVIISHHGLHDWLDDSCGDYFSRRISESRGYEEIKSNISCVVDETELEQLVAAADAEYKEIRSRIKALSRNSTEFAFYLGMLERFLQSALIDADRTDTAEYMSDTKFPEADTCNLWREMKSAMANRLACFADRADIISLQRKSISDRCAAFAKNDVRICRLIVPTGGGKTLSSLRFAIDYCIQHGMERIVYTAPFMSILEQNSDEIRGIAGDRAFVEHYSNAMAELEEDNLNEYSEYELHTERWDSPVIATTMVQFLNTLFLGRTTSVRRMHRLAKSVIIIDEVQSVPLKCVHLLNLAVNFLSHICGATVVLCSATQPVKEETAFPMLVDRNSSMSGDYSEDFEVFRRTDIIPVLTPYGFSCEETADFCFGAFSEQGNLLVIVNTKSTALKLYEMLKSRCSSEMAVIHLSTNMCPQHRRDKIAEMRRLLDDNQPLICVTTQLIDAGVDISFRCVVRSAAGLDNAAQAAGRCNRHGEADRICPVYLVYIREENLNSLREISQAQGITRQIVNSGGYTDLQSVEAVSDYFGRLYRREKEQLSYIASNPATSLLDLLSLDKIRYDASKKTTSRYCSQAFATAGRMFEVIDSRTIDVIVPYDGKAEEIIQQLSSAQGNYTLLLRQAQKYTVGIYSSTRYKLEQGNALRMLPCGAVILDKHYYDDVIGVNLECNEREILVY